MGFNLVGAPRRLDEGRAAPSVRHPHGQARSFLPAVRNGGSARPRDAYRASFSPFRPTVFRAEGGDAKGDDDCARRGLSCDAIGGVACAEARPGAEHGAGGRAGRRRTFVDGRTELYLGGLLKKAWDAEGDKSDAAFLSLLNEYDVSWALVAPGTEAVDKLRRSAQWKEIFQDGDAELFVRN
jgi:hypothetical protein